MAVRAPLVAALDVGTTGVRAAVFDASGTPRAVEYREVLPTHPAPGLVEHDTERLWDAVLAVLRAVLGAIEASAVAGLGITTQRATAVVWDATTGRAEHQALSWQDGRTKDRCDELLAKGLLVIPLMAASKIEWILDRVDPDRSRVGRGALRCGTLDAWLTARLSGGRIVATDHSAASSSGLYALERPTWQPEVCDALRIPVAALPDLVPSSAPLGQVGGAHGLPPLTLAAIAGDQQAAMMGELCTEPGETKISYGTAAMLDVNVGDTPVWPTGGTYPLVLWKRGETITYCLEATAITAGAAITWLRDGLGLLASPADADRVAGSVADAGGAWAVPALQGLGTPYLDSSARAVLGGLSRGTTRAHVVRATLDGIAWRCREAFDALVVDAPRRPEVLRANGGAARSDVLLQAEADAIGIPVERAAVLEAAVLGAAHLAGLATGVWSDVGELRARRTASRVFEPRIGADEREARFAAWRRHVDAARHEE
jgi:glycerol kinase